MSRHAQPMFRNLLNIRKVSVDEVNHTQMSKREMVETLRWRLQILLSGSVRVMFALVCNAAYSRSTLDCQVQGSHRSRHGNSISRSNKLRTDDVEVAELTVVKEVSGTSTALKYGSPN